MIKDGVEDYKRYLSDNEENMKEVKKYERIKHGFTNTKSQELRIGDIIKVQND